MTPIREQIENQNLTDAGENANSHSPKKIPPNDCHYRNGSEWKSYHTEYIISSKLKVSFSEVLEASRNTTSMFIEALRFPNFEKEGMDNLCLLAKKKENMDKWTITKFGAHYWIMWDSNYLTDLYSSYLYGPYSKPYPKLGIGLFLWYMWTPGCKYWLGKSFLASFLTGPTTGLEKLLLYSIQWIKIKN